MKTRMLRWLARVALSLVAIAPWGTGATAQSLSGVYGGEKCPYKLTFRGKDVVYMQIIGIAEVPGQYKVDGDKVPVTAGIYSTVFTRNGDALEGLFEGETVVCRKEYNAITLVPVQGVWTLNYRRVVTQESTPQVFDTRSAPTCSASVRRACGIRPFYLVLDTTNQGQYSYATLPPSDPSYTPLVRGSAAVARDSLILGGAHPATYSLQVYSSQMHLTHHYKLGADAASSFGFRSLPPGDSLEVTGEWWYQRRVADPLAAAPLPPKPKSIDELAVAAMKSDLRNLVTAEEEFFADSVKYSSRIACANPPTPNLRKRARRVQSRAERGSVTFCATAGNVLGAVTVGSDTQGWSANIRNANTPETCAIYIGPVTPLAPATKNDPEGAPVCR